MAKQKVYGLPTLTPVNYDRRTGEYNDPLKGAGYDDRTGNYYDAFAEDGGEYVSPQQYKKKYGLRALAQGGYVQAGEPVIVGDGGQPELFVPDQSGYVYPELPYPQKREEGLWDKAMGALGPSDAYAFYAGPESKTADKEKLTQAQQLAASGERPDNIRRQTGWFQGPDQKWRYEIPDNPAAFVQERLPKTGQSANLSDVYKDDALYQAYPNLRDFRVTGQDMVGAGFNPGGQNINMGREYSTPETGKQDKFKLLTHEVQHAIQDREFTSPGSDPSRDPNYWNRPGEVEARDVAARVGLGPQERLDRAPVQMAAAQPAPQDGAGLSPLQAAQPMPPQNASQAQVAQAVTESLQGGTPRETIQAVMRATGMQGNLVQNEQGLPTIVDKDGKPIQSFRNLQDVVTFAYSHMAGNAGPEKKSDGRWFYDTYYPSDKAQAEQKKEKTRLNEKMLDYLAKIEDRNYNRQTRKEELEFQTQRTMDAENRRVTATYLQQLDRAKKAWAESNKFNIGEDGKVPAFPQDQFDQEFEGMTGISVGALRQQNRQQSGGPGLGQPRPAPQPAPTDQPAPAPAPGGGNKVQDLVGKPAPASQAQQLPPEAVARLKEGVVIKFGNGQSWTLQNGQPVQVQPQARPSQGAPSPAMPEQQEVPQVGLGQPAPVQPQGPAAGERASQAVSSVVNPQRSNEPSPDWQDVANIPEKLEAQYPGIVGYVTKVAQVQRLPVNVVLGILTKGGEGAAKLWQGFQRARQTGLAY